MFCFLTDVVLKTYALRKQYFDMPNSYIEFASGIMIIVYCLASWLWELGQ
jgi:heptaprenylglyceryl phosphate synthase